MATRLEVVQWMETNGVSASNIGVFPLLIFKRHIYEATICLWWLWWLSLPPEKTKLLIIGGHHPIKMVEHVKTIAETTKLLCVV